MFVLSAKEGGAWVAGLFADYGWSRIAGNRFIDNCSDCLREDLDLVDGAFLRAGADVGAVKLRGSDGAFLLNLSYQQYLATSGIAREMRAGFSLWFL